MNQQKKKKKTQTVVMINGYHSLVRTFEPWENKRKTGPPEVLCGLWPPKK